MVLEIVEDKQANLWMGTQHGLLYFEPKKNQFSFWEPTSTNMYSLAGPGCRALWMDKGGMLWIGTDNGISTLHPNTLRLGFENLPKALPKGFELSSVREICKIKDRFFVSTDNGLYTFDDEGIDGYQFLLAGDFTSLFFDKDRTLYIGSVGPNYFYQMDVYTLAFQAIAKNGSQDDKKRLKGYSIKDFTFDHLGKGWIAALGGLNRFDPESGIYEQFYKAPIKDTSYVNLSQSLDLQLDSQNNLWIATTNGLAVLSKSELERFPVTTLNFFGYSS